MNNKIKKASEKFDSLSESGSYKGKFLPDWLNKKSVILTRECEGKTRRHYSFYKNGTIIMVNFGVNIGNELCNNHLAIVLNKKDNKTSSTLTVIPISSKDNKYYHKLSDEVFKLINGRFEVENEQLISSLKKVKENKEKLERVLENTNLPAPELNELLKSNMNDILELEKETKLTFEVRRKYNELAKDSFACISSIQTISKERIRKINRKDPSGKIRLSKKTMEGLDKEIIRFYTNYQV